MTNGLPTIPHLAVPFRITGDRAATVEDGTLEEVTQNVRVVLSSYRGERLVVPEFGMTDPTFGLAGSAPSPAEVEEAVAEWEPRAVLDLQYEEPTGDGVSDVTVHVSMAEEA